MSPTRIATGMFNLLDYGCHSSQQAARRLREPIPLLSRCPSGSHSAPWSHLKPLPRSKGQVPTC
eukprot:8056355-Prorocentrum_lima.AAC.1